MRWAWALILMLPLAGAQTQVMEDGEGDAAASLAGGSTLPEGVVETGPYDLVGLFVEEEPSLFRFGMQVRDLALDSNSFGNGFITLQFQHADRIFRIMWERYEMPGVLYYGTLSVYDSGRGGWTTIERGPVGVDAASNTLRFEVERVSLVDGNGTAPQAGRFLDRFEAFSRGAGLPFFGGGFMVSVEDQMPDQGYGTPYEVVTGLQQTGHARLASSDPVRASNGEKGTFVYHVEATNLDDDEDRFSLSVRNVPDGWDVTLPAATVRLDGNTTRSFPVLVSVPFQHTHGALEEFVLEMKSQRDGGSVGRLQLGIRYLAIPQPAGHHDTVYFHSRTDAAPGGGSLSSLFDGSSDVAAYMNTLETDELDEDRPVPGEGTNLGFVGGQWVWDIFLEPGLQMGLDFDRNRTGDVEVTIDAGALDIPAGQLSGQLIHLRGDAAPDGSLRGTRATTLADVVAGSPTTVSGETVLSAVIQPTPESDLIPYASDAALLLRLRLQGEPLVSTGLAQETLPTLTGGHMRLPLNEYRDRVEGVLNALAGLSFRHDSAADRQVNPGETVLFNMTLRNEGAVDDTFALRVNGTNADWARILGDQRIFVPTGRERAVVVAVAPPADAPDGDIIDLVVTAASQAEPTIQGNIRIVAVVNGAVDFQDESHLVQDIDRSLRKDKQSPGPLVLLPLAMAALLRRSDVPTTRHK